MRRLRFLVVSFWSVASVAVYAQGEVLRALSARPNGVEAVAKSDLNVHYNFQYETQSLPLMDDFSIDRTRKLWASPTDPGVTLDETIYGLAVSGVSGPNMTFADDTTFTYTINTEDPPVTTRMPLPSVQLTVRDLSVYPPTETVITAWPSYTVFDSLANPPSDTIWQTTPNLVQDSLLVYSVPPAGGVYIMNTTTQPLILWADDDVYVNGTYPIDPPSIGVATFDGLARTGYPYNFAQYTSYGIADHLTSVPINLAYSSADSVYLSFFFQARGLSGDDLPQASDSLVLEFYAPDEDQWVRVWRTRYLTDIDFRQVMVPILQARFLKNGFRMRFLNYATLSGSFDHWHLDYVRLATQRTHDDTLLVDVAYKYPESTLLNSYTSVPFNRYAEAPASLMVPSIEVEQCNLDINDRFITYGMSAALTDGNGYMNFFNGTNTSNNAASCFESNHIIYGDSNWFKYDETLSTDAAFWEVKFWTNATPDINKYNDTTRFVQELSNYYAYDDGSAEMGYNLPSAGAKLAYRYDLLGGDSLRAVRIYFDPIANQPPSIQPYDGSFLLTVWTSLSPEVIRHQNFSFSSPEYRRDGLNFFVEYPLDETIYVEGTIYVGWVQTNEAAMNIGFDRNNNSGTKIFYNTGGSWLNTSFQGSLMIRPVMVSAEDPFTGITETPSAAGMLVHPNPASDSFNIRLIVEPAPGATVHCFDATGRTVLQERYISGSAISSNTLANGVYVVRVDNAEGSSIGQARVLIQH